MNYCYSHFQKVWAVLVLMKWRKKPATKTSKSTQMEQNQEQILILALRQRLGGNIFFSFDGKKQKRRREEQRTKQEDNKRETLRSR